MKRGWLAKLGVGSDQVLQLSLAGKSAAAERRMAPIRATLKDSRVSKAAMHASASKHVLAIAVVHVDPVGGD
jgi:hypothetical protein